MVKIKKIDKTYTIKAYLPENLHLADHICKYNPKHYGIESYNSDHAMYLLSQIVEVAASDNRQTDNFNEIDNYTSLYSPLLQSVVKDYRRYMDYFIETQIIETDGYYIYHNKSDLNEQTNDFSSKPKSYGYRYFYKYQHSILKENEYSEVFERLLVRKRERYINGLYLKYNHLTKWLFPTRGKCGLVLADGKPEYYITTKRKAQLADSNLLEYKKDRRTGAKVKKDPDEQYRSNLISIKKIRSGKLSCNVDDNVHRLHSPLTNLKKELRNYITYQNSGKIHKLFTIDIVNSQPYISTLLLNVNNTKHIRKIAGMVDYKPALHMLLKLCDLYESQEFVFCDDVKLFKSLVSNIDENPLDLYTYMLNACNKKGIYYKNREEIKVGMYGVLFGSVEVETKTKKAFAELFPTVYEVFKLIKQRDKKDLSCLLQCIESNFVLLKLTKSVSVKYPNAPLFTIHDSITTTEEYKERVYAVITEELNKLIGLPPKLKVEEWSPDNVNIKMYESVLLGSS